jgi:hypothetical protein
MIKIIEMISEQFKALEISGNKKSIYKGSSVGHRVLR